MKIKLLLTSITVQMLLSSCTTIHKLPPNVVFSESGKYVSPDGKVDVTIDKTYSGELSFVMKSNNNNGSKCSSSAKYPLADKIFMCWDNNSMLWYHVRPGYVERFASTDTTIDQNLSIYYGNSLEWLEKNKYQSMPLEFKKYLLQSIKNNPYIQKK